MISQTTIDNVFSVMDPVEIIGQHVELKPSGNSYKGKCPFHQENDSSFSISPELNIFKCFGCGISGTGVKFLMEYKNYSYPQAIREIAKHYSIEVIEESSEKEDKKDTHKRELFYQLYDKAKDYYHHMLFKDENSVALEYALSRFSLDQIDHYQIGYAPDSWQGLLNHLLNATPADNDLLHESKLISRSKKGRDFDTFRNRLMFPIWNASHRVIAFGGRVLPGNDGPKYINSSNSLIFNKSKSLYLIDKAIRPIRETATVTIVEGYTDAIALHSNDITNCVAPCGTALSDDQINQLSKLAKSATLVYDADAAGSQAGQKHAMRLIEKGMIVNRVTLPEGMDPYEFYRSQGDNPDIKDHSEDFLFSKARQFAENSDDPMARHDGVKFLSRLIFSYKDKPLRTFYIDELSKIIKGNKRQFTDELASLEASHSATIASDDDLPEGTDVGMYEKYGFYSFNNEYYFRKDKGGRAKLSNFIMKPVFHVESANDTKRIYELVNFKGHKIVVDFDMQEMVSINNFKRNIEGRGNFLFWGQDQHMNRLKLKLYEDTRTCNEIANLGWQKEGFFAWANGITLNDGSFQSIDDYGLVEYNNKNYFIPAFSKIYIDDRSIYLDERKFKYQDRDISLDRWSELIIKVFGDNAKLGIAFWIASVFRDHILHIFNNFPILNLFGPKGTGKSQMAMSLSCLFGTQQTPFNIHNGTKPGLAEHIQQFVNSIAWIDEYKNNIEYDKIETLKSIYDAIGRSRMNMDKGKKKETTHVNSAVILSGQEMPTADVALFSRMIFLQFHQTEYSQQEKDNYEELKNIEKQGLSHLTSQIISHRKYFEENFYGVFDSVLRDVFKELEHSGIEDRILKSFCSILAAYKSLEKKLSLNMDYDNLRSIAIKAIKDQNSQISSSNEVSMFWETLEALFDENLITDRWHFKIDMLDRLKLIDSEKKFNSGINVLKLKYSVIYKLYAKYSKQSGESVLPNSTLKYYLQNNPAFLGVEKSSRFILKEYSADQGKIVEKNQITSAYCFNYDILKSKINLIRTQTEVDPLGMNNSSGPDSVNPDENNHPF